MKPLEVNIATLKSKLSEYLKKVKQGAEIVVLDRKYPIARITNLQKEEEEFPTVLPLDAKPIGEFKFPRVKVRAPTKSTELLLEDRKKR